MSQTPVLTGGQAQGVAAPKMRSRSTGVSWTSMRCQRRYGQRGDGPSVACGSGGMCFTFHPFPPPRVESVCLAQFASLGSSALARSIVVTKWRIDHELVARTSVRE